MEENGTTGIVSTQGFQSINQEIDSTARTQVNNIDKSNDPLGIQHWPGLFRYLEEHFTFSACLLAIVGYVIIASFGSMENLGQYLGYIVFLCIILFIYNFDYRNKKYLYIFIVIMCCLISIILIQNWKYVSVKYRYINKVFQINNQTQSVGTTTTPGI